MEWDLAPLRVDDSELDDSKNPCHSVTPAYFRASSAMAFGKGGALTSAAWAVARNNAGMAMAQSIRCQRAAAPVKVDRMPD